MKLPDCEIAKDAPLTRTERLALGILAFWPVLFVLFLASVIKGC